jgi:chloramphenicol O-acetyltransferase type A
MKRKLNIEKWERKDHFKFFNSFEEPFFGVTIDIDCTKAYKYCKEKGISFFLFYLHKSLVAANKIEPFRYRINNGKVFIYDKVNASPTINRPNGTFDFAYMEFFPEFSEFEAKAKLEIEKTRNSNGLTPAISGENVIHYSSIPWLRFTSMSHARSFAFKDSCPKISFGMMSKINGVQNMPVSIHVHHALMDGFHVGEFVNEFQKLMNEN